MISNHEQAAVEEDFKYLEGVRRKSVPEFRRRSGPCLLPLFCVLTLLLLPLSDPVPDPLPDEGQLQPVHRPPELGPLPVSLRVLGFQRRSGYEALCVFALSDIVNSDRSTRFKHLAALLHTAPVKQTIAPLRHDTI